MKKLLSLILVCLMVTSVFPIGVFSADSAVTEDFTYELSEDGNSYCIKSYNITTKSKVKIPSTYNNKPVTEIGRGAFSTHSEITDITIPSSIKVINSYAFSSCKGLKNLVIPDSTEEIGYGIILADTGIESITVPFIGRTKSQNDDCTYPFGYFAGYTDPEMKEYLGTGISQRVIENKYGDIKTVIYDVLPSIKNVTVTGGKVPFNAFSGWKNIETVTLLKGVYSIEDYAFENCTSLKSITIPDTVKSIGNYAFYRCLALKEIVLSANTRSIGDEAFYNCTALSNVDMPIGVKNVGLNAFTNTKFYNNNDNWINGTLYLNRCLLKVDETKEGSFIVKADTETIGDGAFENCTGITDVTLSESVTTIGDEAFYGCSSLKAVAFGSYTDYIGDKAFFGCSALYGTYTFDKVEKIGESAFENCVKLEGISFTNSLKEIKEKAFYKCEMLGNVTLPDCVEKIEENAFSGTELIYDKNYKTDGIVYINNQLIDAVGSVSGTVTIKDGTVTVADRAFQSKSSITQVVFPSSLKYIGEKAFYNCSGITSVSIPKNVLKIGYGAFWKCDSIISVTTPFTGIERDKSKNPDNCFGTVFGTYVDKSDIPYKYTVIPSIKYVTITDDTAICDYSFYRCGNIKSVKLNSGINEIGFGAFSRCEALTKIDIPEGVTKIGDEAFTGCINLAEIDLPTTLTTLGEGTFANCTYLSEITIPSGVKVLPRILFGRCENLTTVNIPEGVTTIDEYTFNECKSLTEVNLPSTLEKISAYGFYCCKNLKTINLDNVKYIDKGAFYYCTSLENVYLGENLTYLGTSAFYKCNENLVICGYKGTAAQSYAKQNNIEFIDITSFTQPKFTKIENTSAGLSLTWSKSAASKGYFVYRSIEGTDNFTEIYSTTVKDNNTFIDKTAKAGTSYRYAVKAVNGNFETDTYVTKNIHTRLLQPSLKSAKALNTNSINIVWGEVKGAKYYNVYRKASGEKSWSRLATVKSGTTYTDTTVKSGKTYYYTVKAFNGKSYSTYNKTGIKILYLATPNTKASKTGGGVKITWNKISGANGYCVYRMKQDGSGWAKIAQLKSNSKISYTDKSVKKGKTYTYTVKAYYGKTTSSNKKVTIKY